MEQTRGISDLCMYELEDIVWDEFDRTDDHIVPHQDGIEVAFKGDSCKKRQREVIDISSKAADRSSAKYASQGKVSGGFHPLKNTRATMLEKDSWSHTPEGVFLASRDSDSNKEVSSLASDGTRISNHCFESSKIDTTGSGFCDDGPMIGEGCDAVDSNSYCYSLGDISQADNVLSFYSDTNYDDVDRMFSCDSMFGNEDELSWLASAHNIEGSENVLTPDFKFSCLESSMFKDKPEHGQYSSVDDSNLDSSCISYKHTFPASSDDWTFVDGSNPISESNGEFTPKQEIIFHENQAKQHNESEGKRKNQCLENGCLFHNIGNIRSKDTKLPSGDSSCQVFTSPHFLKQEGNSGPNSFHNLPTNFPCVISECSHSADHVPDSSTTTGIKSETNDGLGSLLAEESSYAPNPVSKETYLEYFFEAPSVTMDDKRENLPLREGFQPSFSSNPNHVDLLVHPACCDPISLSKHVHHSQTEVENHSNFEGAGIRMPADFDTSDVQETSCMSSGFDEIPQDACSFHDLQQVMEQLDISTKLCIRDSLYRLARSAEKRHYANLNGGSICDTDNGGALMDDGTNDCNGFMEIETDTNPIDRSIAHLLFHRPTDSSAMPTLDGLSLKSNTMIKESITSPPVISKKIHGEGKPATEEDIKVADY